MSDYFHTLPSKEQVRYEEKLGLVGLKREDDPYLSIQTGRRLLSCCSCVVQGGVCRSVGIHVKYISAMCLEPRPLYPGDIHIKFIVALTSIVLKIFSAVSQCAICKLLLSFLLRLALAQSLMWIFRDQRGSRRRSPPHQLRAQLYCHPQQQRLMTFFSDLRRVMPASGILTAVDLQEQTRDNRSRTVK